MSHPTLPHPRHRSAHLRPSMGRRHARDEAPPPPEGFDWSASGWAGLVAGGAFIVIQTSFTSMFTGDAKVDAIRQIAAIALGESVLPDPTKFTALVFMAAMGVHLIMSLIYARILAAIIHGMSTERAISIGAGFGAVLYAINYYAFTNFFPWFAVSRGWITLFSHVVFGMLAAGVYEWLTMPNRKPPEGPLII